MDQHRIRQLERVDWDFIASRGGSNPGLHWYPGNFVPELPGALIDILSRPGDRVFDPFGGVGTTALAAIVRGRAATCCDMNPVAILASYVTTTLILLRRMEPVLFDGVLADLLTIVGDGNATSLPLAGEIGTELAKAVGSMSSPSPDDMLGIVKTGPPARERLEPWYSRSTLAKLLDMTARVDDPSRPSFARLVGWAMISSIAKSLSSQTQSWGHVADRVLPHEFVDKDPARAALAWIKRIRRGVCSVADSAERPINHAFSIRKVDWSYDIPSDLPVADLLITSPPYAGAIDYILAQRLSLYLLGHDELGLSQLVVEEMGARRKRYDRNHVTAWADGLYIAVERQLACMNPGSIAAFVMPHKDAGRKLGEERLKSIMDLSGWVLDFEKDRSIRQAKARQSWTSIKQETLFVFSRSPV